ncbi:MAG TPA: family 1 glycosylhydrolase [Acidimicrobiales bacterium]
MAAPTGFLWGVTSSSTGTEGVAPAADWSAWERSGRAPASHDGNGWRTNYADDARLLASLGLNALRITIEWARLEPAPDRVDGAEVEHQRRVLEVVRDAGLQPWITLHHGSLPGWFADDEGGYRDRRARGYFWPRHIDRCGEWFGDLVAGWVPIEDPIGWAIRGFLCGVRPPGRRDPEVAREAIIGALEANHLAWRMLRGSGAPVMCVLGLRTVRAAAAEARNEAARWRQLLWDVPLRARRDGVLAVPGGAEIERPEMAGAFDLLGIAYDHPIAIDATGTAGPYPPTARRDATGFAPNPNELGEVLEQVAEAAPGVPLVVAANGVATADESWAEELLRETLDVLDAVRDGGVDVRGYFHDTGIDGYEWNFGFDVRRGLVSRDRSVKPSGRLLQERIG